MDKSPEAFRTISEVAETLDVPPHVLRFWETRFAQVKPVKRGGGRRYYRPEDVRLLRGIRGLLYDDGMTIKGVQKILRERGIRHVIGLGTLPGSEAEREAPPPPAPAERRAAVPANGGHPVPQGDLFDTGSAAVMTAPAATRSAGAPPHPLDKAALKRLLAELVQLREVMTGDPSR
jgi:DNA-binding transcriptional MerR regulator